MSKIFDDINALPILEVLATAGINYKKDSWSSYMYSILKTDGSVDTSFKVNESKNIAIDFGGDGVKGWPFDIIGRMVLEQDTQTDSWKVTTLKWFVDKGLVKDESVKKAFVKSLNKEELLEQFETLKLGGYKQEVWKWLSIRWFSHEFIHKNQLVIGEIFKDIGYYDNFYCTELEWQQDSDGKWIDNPQDKAKTVQVLLFPCMNEYGVIIGMKMRRIDGKTIWGKKSMAVGNTGLIFNKLSSSQTVYICEGEADWVVMQLLGYKNTVGNLAGVQGAKDKLKSLLYENIRIICLYDNDDPWQLGKLALSEYIGRPLYQVDMPIREDKNGKKLSDVNDLYRVGYDTKAKWDKVFAEAYEVWDISESNKKNWHRYIFLDKYLEFYDTNYKRVQQAWAVASSMGLTGKELNKLVMDQIIMKYEDLCYWYGGKEGFYNTLDETSIVIHGWDSEAIIHPHIEALIDNISWHKKKNSEWLHKAILYKLTHINDVNIPAVILYWSWWSGKGTFINLLSKIFWQENTQVWLWQRDLEWSFDSYVWQKLIVEFKEISSWNTHEDKKILDRIKGFIGEKRITVNSKFQNAKEVDNIAWFHMSSNHPIPIQLDSKQSWNRRFTIIKTGNMLNQELAVTMNRVTFENKQVIKQYVSWLYETYPEVPGYTTMLALENDEKKMVEDQCEWVGNLFFEWFEEEYPTIYKVSNKQFKVLLDMYKNIEAIDYNDKRFTQKNLDFSLSHRIEKKKVWVDGASVWGYMIKKDKNQMLYMPEWSDGTFSIKDWQEVLRKRDALNFNN